MDKSNRNLSELDDRELALQIGKIRSEIMTRSNYADDESDRIFYLYIAERLSRTQRFLELLHNHRERNDVSTIDLIRAVENKIEDDPSTSPNVDDFIEGLNDSP